MIEEARITASDSINPDELTVDDVSVSVSTDSDDQDNLPMKLTGVSKLCATRWLVCTPALRDVLRAYDAIQVAF